MGYLWLNTKHKLLTVSALLILLVIVLSGCGAATDYLAFMGRHKSLESSFQSHPSLEARRELYPEDCFYLSGRILMNRPYNGPVLIVAVSDRYAQREIVATRILRSPATFYSLFLPEGEYDLLAFVDLNNNNYFESQEMIGWTPVGKRAAVNRSLTIDGITVLGPEVKLDFNVTKKAEIPVNTKVTVNSYKYTSLDDDFFDSRYGTMGVYRPTQLLTHTQGSIFSLEEYDAKKTVVLFVHGMEGTPQDWKYMVDGLDRSRFQAWFYYYPSGLPLAQLESHLANSIIERNTRHTINQLVIVAHSMGGLVARSAIDTLSKRDKPSYLKMYISMSSPYGGVEDANSGLKSAPVVVPSWRDVATESVFLTRLYQQETPQNLPFYMFFSYRNRSGASGDGVIALKSQLDSRIHMKAIKTYGFDTTHVGILNDEAVRREFYRLLETVQP